MISVIPPGDPAQIRIIGKSQGYNGLAVHFGSVIDPTTGRETPALTTAWEPTQQELVDLLNGGKIVIQLINIVQHPPIAVFNSAPPGLD